MHVTHIFVSKQAHNKLSLEHLGQLGDDKIMQRLPEELSGTTTTLGVPKDVVTHTIPLQVSSE